jgi:hypothetical protein
VATAEEFVEDDAVGGVGMGAVEIFPSFQSLVFIS